MCRFTVQIAIFVPLLPIGCSRTPPSPDVASLERKLGDADPAARARAARELAKHGEAAAVALPALIDSLRHADVDVRQSAAVAIGKIGPAAGDAIPALTLALGDAEWPVRRAAVQALGEIGDPAALPAVRAALSDRDSLVRKAAGDSVKRLSAK